MDTIEQSAALDPALIGGRDRAKFFRAERHDRLEGLTAAFRRHRYEPHTHDTYVVGIILAGCETWRLNGVRHYAGPGSLCFVNPGEVHDGEPAGEGYAYRMTYPSIDLLRSVAAEVTDRDDAAAPYFAACVVPDPQAARMFLDAHLKLEADPDGLAGEEALVEVYAHLLRRHARLDRPAGRLSAHGPAMRRVREFLDASLATDPDLGRLAELAGLSRDHLIRLFKRETGLTPHAYLMDARVREARRLLARGEAPADVALACGFFDQSHLNRCFKPRVGTAPGAYRRG
ncbi:AraC family transcriptional regulator [Methylobrevis pamukkalensis]|uniref:HTH-type transcriptional activator RhaS n=1 Tax=Methylobrevis pamukkalensis TaxID=1439726 RepID=A0A1E3H7G0_9HYPH|nr:AraC family transcriptional regulator [Methylobrevis pamukkalensis]ODN71441.1 HTH-type transcriptional activator RhaS [Methylobrevis pamukkalensis]